MDHRLVSRIVQRELAASSLHLMNFLRGVYDLCVRINLFLGCRCSWTVSIHVLPFAKVFLRGSISIVEERLNVVRLHLLYGH